MSDAAPMLASEAGLAAADLPALLAEAERAAVSIAGVHGRRAAGPGETFWQYRQAQPGDAATQIDWRRSGRSDEMFVRETEWESAQTVYLWADTARSMRFASRAVETTKARRAAVLSLAIAMLLERGGERFSVMTGAGARALRGRAGVTRAALTLIGEAEQDVETGAPPKAHFATGSRALFLSDFFGDMATLTERLEEAISRRVSGMLVQVVDPVEEAFPYSGRVLFESIGGAMRYEADRAEAIRDAYVARLAERREALQMLARKVGWRFAIHRTDAPATPILLAMHQTLEARGIAA